MAIAFVSGSYQDSGGLGTGLNILVPPGAVAGNLLVAVVETYNAAVTAVDAGWTPYSSSPGTLAGNVAVFTRVLTAPPPASYGFSVFPANGLGVLLANFSGAGAVDGTCSFNPAAGSSGTATANSVTPGAGNTADFWVTAYTNVYGDTYTTPSGATVAFNGHNPTLATSIYMFYEALSSAAATGTQSSTQSAAHGYNSVSFLLPPSGPTAITGAASVALGPLVVGSAGTAAVPGTAALALGPLVIAVTNAGIPVFIYVGWIPHTNATGQPP